MGKFFVAVESKVHDCGTTKDKRTLIIVRTFSSKYVKLNWKISNQETVC